VEAVGEQSMSPFFFFISEGKITQPLIVTARQVVTGRTTSVFSGEPDNDNYVIYFLKNLFF
jgi:hypothetical protein